MRKSVIATGAIALALTISLAGCVNGMIPDIKPTHAPTSSSTPSPSGTPVTVPGDNAKPGDVISKDQALACRNDLSGPCSAYKLDDGTWVYIDKSQPLPPVVEAAVTATADANPVINDPSSSGQNDQVGKSDSTLSAIQFATGKKVVLVSYGMYYDPSFGGAGPHLSYQVMAGFNRLAITDDRDSAIGVGNDFIASQPDAAMWTLVSVSN